MNRIRHSNSIRISKERSLAGSLLFTIPIAVSLLISRLVFAIPQEPGGSAFHVLLYAVTAIFSAVLFVPLGTKYSAQNLLMAWRACPVVLFIFVMAVLADSQTRVISAQILPLALMLLVVLMAALAAVLALQSRCIHARQIAFTALAILFAIPVWLGPLAEQTGNLPVLTNLIIGASPLSAIAVSIDLDYLRTSWFYQHSVLGSLRYDYVSWSAYLMIFTIIAAGFAGSAANWNLNLIMNILRTGSRSYE